MHLVTSSFCQQLSLQTTTSRNVSSSFLLLVVMPLLAMHLVTSSFCQQLSLQTTLVTSSSNVTSSFLLLVVLPLLAMHLVTSSFCQQLSLQTTLVTSSSNVISSFLLLVVMPLLAMHLATSSFCYQQLSLQTTLVTSSSTVTSSFLLLVAMPLLAMHLVTGSFCKQLSLHTTTSSNVISSFLLLVVMPLLAMHLVTSSFCQQLSLQTTTSSNVSSSFLLLVVMPLLAMHLVTSSFCQQLSLQTTLGFLLWPLQRLKNSSVCSHGRRRSSAIASANLHRRSENLLSNLGVPQRPPTYQQGRHQGLLASVLGARTLLVAPGLTTRNQKLLGASNLRVTHSSERILLLVIKDFLRQNWFIAWTEYQSQAAFVRKAFSGSSSKAKDLGFQRGFQRDCSKRAMKLTPTPLIPRLPMLMHHSNQSKEHKRRGHHHGDEETEDTCKENVGGIVRNWERQNIHNSKSNGLQPSSNWERQNSFVNRSCQHVG